MGGGATSASSHAPDWHAARTRAEREGAGIERAECRAISRRAHGDPTHVVRSQQGRELTEGLVDAGQSDRCGHGLAALGGAHGQARLLVLISS